MLGRIYFNQSISLLTQDLERRGCGAHPTNKNGILEVRSVSLTEPRTQIRRLLAG